MIPDINKVNTDNCEHYTWGDNGECDGWHLVKSSHLSVILEKVPPGSAEQAHCHLKAEQFFYILSGEACFELDSRCLTLSAGEGLHIPAGVNHRLVNKGERELVFTLTSTPPSHGDRRLVEF